MRYYAAGYSLRTIGIKQDKLVSVTPHVEVRTRGGSELPIRPAMWVKIGK